MYSILRFTFTSFVIVIGAVNAHAEEHGSPPKQHVAVFAGVGIEENKQGHEETGSAIGLEYHWSFHAKWSIGADIEKLFGEELDRSWVIAMPLSFNVTEGWRLFLGPGYEFHGSDDRYLTRTGTSYEFELGGGWSLAPEIVIDFVSGGTTTYVAGIAVGYGF